ncbi:MAG: methyltransferase domain-containing protein [Clostridia bacterium]|nr:methyltransferase domain-containing protein [Clostridia bacterium]
MKDNISAFCCPVCGKALNKEGKTLRCSSGHCYDYAKSGYVNLLMSQQGTLHGDDKAMVHSRTAFLSAGHYKPLMDQIYDAAVSLLPEAVHLFDAGCGEGWYTQQIHEKLEQDGFSVESVGVDISKDALNAAAKRKFGGEFAVASLFHLPMPDEWANFIINVFAPDCIEEFSRILIPGGVYVKAIPLEDHLLELKKAVYDSVYENEVVIPQYDSFTLVSDTKLRYNLHLTDTETIKNLFSMTPYARKTSLTDIQKLDSLSELNTTAAFSILLYQKN